MKIDLKNLTTNTFNRIKKAVKRFVIVYGGSGSSKSYSMHQFLILKSFSDKYDTLILRKTGSSLRNSVFAGILLRVKSMSMYHLFEFNYSNDNRVIKNKLTGIKMIFSGLDDPEKIKSVENIHRVFVEESNQINLTDFEELNRRVRGKDNIQIYLLFNPVSINHWLKKYFFDNQNISKDCDFIHCTYKDNEYLTAKDIEQLENLKYTNLNDYNIYALGLWGNPSEGLVWCEVPNFNDLKDRQNKIYWTKYETLPDIDFFELFALDFGGAGAGATDELNGKSKYVLEKMYINKDLMVVYHKLLLYKGFIDHDNLVELLEKKVGKSSLILADNARSDKILELLIKGFSIIGAKTKEGKSSAVNTGYDILKKYSHYYHVEDIPMHVERENHKWIKDEKLGVFIDQVEDLYKDTSDTARYGVVYYDLNYNY